MATISDEKLQEIEGEKGSFLAFLYRIRFDPEVSKAFRASGQLPLPAINPVARDFGLTHPAYSEILNELHAFYYPNGYPDYGNEYVVSGIRGQAVSQANELWGRLAALLVPEFRTFSEGTIADFPFVYPSEPPHRVVADARKVATKAAPPSWW
jgi:hypothetical protein